MPIIQMDLTAGAIYVVRNPLDLVISLADHYGVDIDKAIEVMSDPNNGGLADGNIVFEIHSIPGRPMSKAGPAADPSGPAGRPL